jgi:pimeloyl-ACP methyl ester carboxylesterase
MSKTFVMIHGSWHCGWAWQGVMRHLAGNGHVTHAPTLPGHGPQAARHGIKHQDCVSAVIAYIQERCLEDITLVGHSFGGTVVQKLAEELPNRITRMVFLDALIVEDGQCVFDVLPPEYAALFNDLAGASSDNSVWRPSSVDTRAYSAAFTDTTFNEVRREAIAKVCHRRSFVPTRFEVLDSTKSLGFSRNHEQPLSGTLAPP